MFSDNLRKRRLELGMSQTELAQKVGYRSRSSITKLESGISDVSQKKLRMIATALNTTPEALLQNSELPEMDPIPSSQKRIENKGRVIALIQAGGKSTRNMFSIPSQFITVDEKPIIAYVLEAYEKHPQIDEIDVICLYGWEKTLLSYARQYNITKLNKIVTGGNTIVDSVKLGMSFLKNNLQEDDIIILQEATRPMINSGLISKIISSYHEFGDSVFVKSMADYVQIEIQESCAQLCNRNTMFSMESPEIYTVGHLKKALEIQKKLAPDDGSCCAVMMERLEQPLHYCECSANNLKIVTQEDIYIFKVLKQVIL